MSNIRKLSTFRQLSLTCETPTHETRRKSLKKQFSEDLPDLKDNWLDPGVCIKIAVNSKSRKSLDRPPPVKIAWEENTRGFKTEDAVIIKKCTELKRPATSKLVRHSSLENDSILYTKPKFSEILQPTTQEPEKSNLNIFLAYNTKESNAQNSYNNKYDEISIKPKIMAPLFATDNKNVFQIRKNPKPKINLNEIAYSPTRTDEKVKIKRQDSLIASFPDKEKENTETLEELKINTNAKTEPKAINNVIIRPMTAASKREKFQKRTNSAFTSITKETTPITRPPLVRSSSAPCKPDQTKSKFLATKRKIKSAKRTQFKPQTSFAEECVDNDEENQKVLDRTVSVNGSDIVTMVSLVSPDGSDVEENVEEVKEKEKPKPAISPNKNFSKENDIPKNFSLRKTVKSVSFQQSSIHAIRSFSASFPARRGSVATSLMLNQNKIGQNIQKGNEKRSTNSTIPDDDERVPKRRLVRSSSEKVGTVRCEPNEDKPNETPLPIVEATNEPNITVDIKNKESQIEEKDATKKTLETAVTQPEEEEKKEATLDDGERKFESTKEKECWEMYCKMSGKGINISYDTILRGMLTPTEYRMRRKETVVAPIDNC